MKQDRAINNLIAGLAEDIDAAQMMMDGRLAGDAKSHAETSARRLREVIPDASTKVACDLGRVSCEVAINGDTYFIKARRP